MSDVRDFDLRNSVETIIDFYEAALSASYDKTLAKEMTVNYIINTVRDFESKKPVNGN